jgi:hypothetical protein
MTIWNYFEIRQKTATQSLVNANAAAEKPLATAAIYRARWQKITSCVIEERDHSRRILETWGSNHW